MARAGRRLIAVTAAAVLSVTGAGCNAGLRPGAPVLIGPAGSASLLWTDQSVVWSLHQADGAPAVLRSADSGRTWRVVLAGHQIGGRAAASFFLGASHAWVVQERRGRSGAADPTTVLGTSNGGATWWRGRPLPRDQMPSWRAPHDQVYFADPIHGWLVSSATRLSAPSLSRPGQAATEVLRLWRTTDGGHTWTLLPSRGLPLQHLSVLRAGNGTGCPEQPAVTFANASAGWLTEGACGSGHAGPVVWRTQTAGRRWAPARLPAPPGGWADGSIAASGGIGADVGPARVINEQVSAILLVPVTDGPRIVIEKSADGGQAWSVAAQVSTGVTSGATADCFDPLSTRQWVISAPGELIETADGGRRWAYHGSAMILPGAPVSFSTLRYGFLQVTGLSSAMRTRDGGRIWIAEPAPSPAPAG